MLKTLDTGAFSASMLYTISAVRYESLSEVVVYLSCYSAAAAMVPKWEAVRRKGGVMGRAGVTTTIHMFFIFIFALGGARLFEMPSQTAM